MSKTSIARWCKRCGASFRDPEKLGLYYCPSCETWGPRLSELVTPRKPTQTYSRCQRCQQLKYPDDQRHCGACRKALRKASADA